MAQDLRLKPTFLERLSPESRQRLRALQEVDLERQKRAAIDHGADPDLVERAELGLRRFLALPVLYPERENNFVPTRAIDLLWHELILETVKYHTLCEDAYGTYLHHIPKDDDPTIETGRESPDYAFTQTCLDEAFMEADDEIRQVGAPARCGPCMFGDWRHPEG